ncbi:MAG: hypothetical protein KatS3mg076_0821 [Candidatus Binatia bacterium]|nr:MAG: hypothetical protein KatS3mg076_0821 [Candidatus Binatia bacterium]
MSLVLEMPEPLRRRTNRAWVVGLVAAAFAAAGALSDPESFYRAYLPAFVFWSGIAFGSLPVLMLYFLTGGAWGAVIRRNLEAALGTLPLVALFFLPVLAGLGDLYEWAHPEAVRHDPLLLHKSPYLNVPFFTARTAVFFAMAIGASWLARRWSAEEDRSRERGSLERRYLYLGRAGLVLYVVVGSFVAVDWVQSLEPHWYSTIFGLVFLGGQFLSAFCFAIVTLVLVVRFEPYGRLVGADTIHDLGRLLLAFVMIWAYFAYSQFLVIWSGNLPEEISWYEKRLAEPWVWAAGALLVFHFAVPFLLLLSRRVKRDPRLLGAVAAGLLVFRFVDQLWSVKPAFGAGVGWLDAACWVGLGGFWIHAYGRELAARPLLPLHDPSFPWPEEVDEAR